MRVDRSVSRCSGQALSILVGNVLVVAIHVALCQSKVYDVDLVAGLLRATDQKVVRLDVTMDNLVIVHSLDSFEHLASDQQHCLQVELASAVLEKVLNRAAEKVHHHYVELMVRH